MPLTYLQMLALWAPIVISLAWLALFLARREQAARDDAERMRRGVAAHNRRMDSLCGLRMDCGTHADRPLGCATCPRQWRVKLREERRA